MVKESTGEMYTTYRTVIIAANGEKFQCVSEFVAKSFGPLVHRFGKGALSPPLPIKIIQKTTGNKRKVFILQPAD
jgi:hypothetical protein